MFAMRDAGARAIANELDVEASLPGSRRAFL